MMAVHCRRVVLVVLLLVLVSDRVCPAPVLEYSSSFPVHVNSTFQMILSAMKEYKMLSVIRVEILRDGNVLIKSLIYPGISDQMEDRVSNEFFWLENWYKDSSGRLHLLVRLLEASNNMWLCVSIIEPRTKTEKNLALKDPCSKGALLHAHIQLTIHPTLDLSITTRDGRTDGVHHNDDALVECVSSKGVPPYIPSISYPSSLKVRSSHTNKDTKTAMIYFLASIKDHGKKVSCTAGQSYVSTTIKVFHNPRTIYLRPSYSTYLSNGSSVECISSDGFPKPTVKWIFISGPPKASSFYRISPSNNLTMLPHAPIASSWTFNCSAINSITKSYDSGVTETFSFIIYPVNKATTIILGLMICGGLLLLIVIVILCNRKRIHKKIDTFLNSRSGKNKDQGDDTLNNLSSSYFTYPTVPESTVEPGLELESKKPPRKSRRNKAKRDSDIYEEDNIV